MTDTFNVYCDESCHLEHDNQSVMLLGAVWCSVEKSREVSIRLREIKQRHGLAKGFEVKWTKISPGKVDFYLDYLDYFFDDDDLHLRALIVPNKAALDHERFKQDHDTWYYKMYFDMLKVIFDPRSKYRVFVDIKDTQGGAKITKLHEVLCNNIYDFSRQIIERVQLVHSKQIEQIQLADLLIGAIAYQNRGLRTSSAKMAIAERMKARSGYNLTQTTLLREDKVNLLRWRAQEVSD